MSIKLFWTSRLDIKKNFGDELSPYIVRKLSGKDVVYVPVPSNPLRALMSHSKKFILGKIKLTTFFSLMRTIFTRKYIVAIGSIISWACNSKCTIWGTGLLFRNGIIPYGANIKAVRGKCTQQRIKELNMQVPEVIGDPALLLPLIYSPSESVKHELGIIPHYVHYRSILNIIDDPLIKIINLYDSVEKVIDDINSCKVTISTSLHGIIVSHAYGIPCLWYDFNGAKLYGDNVKFEDYFSSVNIETYSPTLITKELLLNRNDIVKDVIHNSNSTIDEKVLNEIQKGLLSVAPFDVLLKYQIM